MDKIKVCRVLRKQKTIFCKINNIQFHRFVLYFQNLPDSGQKLVYSAIIFSISISDIDDSAKQTSHLQ